MTSELRTDRLGRLAQLAAEADEAVRETVGYLTDDEPANITEPIEQRDQQEVDEPEAASDVNEVNSVDEADDSRLDDSGPDDTDRDDTDLDDDLITMASGLDVGLEFDPPFTPTPEVPAAKAATVTHESAHRGSKPSTMSLATFVGAAAVLLALVGLFVITQVTGDSEDDVASPDATERVEEGRSTPVEDASDTDTLERAPATQVSRTNSEPQDVDLVATVGEVTNESMPDTAWELVGSEPGTAMIAEVVDPAWLQSTFEQTLDDDGEPVAFTFFAPSDSALASLGDAQLETFATNDDRAKDFIDSHIVDVRLTEDDLRAQVGSSLITRSGLSIEVALDGDQLVLNGQPALFPSLVAANGTLIVIDDVLHMPDADDAG